jgi:choline dehydrogenase-like flavoprotein
MATGPVDVLIIGTGASGAAMAWRLSEAGFNVVCLEQGKWQRPDEYPPAYADWEFRGATSFAFDPNVRGLPEDYPVNDTQSDITPLMFNAVAAPSTGQRIRRASTLQTSVCEHWTVWQTTGPSRTSTLRSILI